MHSVLHINIKNFNKKKKISLMRQLKKKTLLMVRRKMKGAFISKRDRAIVVPVHNIFQVCVLN